MTAPGYLEVKGWEEFQHYKTRDPLWIKLYRRLQDNYEWLHLPDASKGHLVGLWILASKHGNRIPADPAYIAQRIGATERVNLEVLITAGFIAHASDALADCSQDACLERETETEKETEKETTGQAARAAVPDFKTCLKLTIDLLYLGNRPSESVMRTEGSLVKTLGTRFGYDRLAPAIQGLARRRDSGEFPNVKPRQAMSLKWLNSAKFDINQLAASEDAFYRSDPEPRRGRGKATDVGSILANITPRTA